LVIGLRSSPLLGRFPLSRHLDPFHQTDRVIEFATGRQSGIGGDTRTAQLQLETVVETEPKSVGMGSPADCTIIAKIQRDKIPNLRAREEPARASSILHLGNAGLLALSPPNRDALKTQFLLLVDQDLRPCSYRAQFDQRPRHEMMQRKKIMRRCSIGIGLDRTNRLSAL